VTALVRRKRRLVLETPYRIQGRALIVHVERWGLRVREKGRRSILDITWGQVYNRAAEIAAELARQEKRERQRTKRRR
jgi:hypothetical protein